MLTNDSGNDTKILFRSCTRLYLTQLQMTRGNDPKKKSLCYLHRGGWHEGHDSRSIKVETANERLQHTHT